MGRGSEGECIKRCGKEGSEATKETGAINWGERGRRESKTVQEVASAMCGLWRWDSSASG